MVLTMMYTTRAGYVRALRRALRSSVPSSLRQLSHPGSQDSEQSSEAISLDVPFFSLLLHFVLWSLIILIVMFKDDPFPSHNSPCSRIILLIPQILRLSIQSALVHKVHALPSSSVFKLSDFLLIASTSNIALKALK